MPGGAGMLELNAVEISQGGFRLNADLKLEASQRLAVIGPSGGGKSTLLAGIAGFAQVSAGQILWNGAALPKDPGARPVAMLFQDHNLFPHLSILQNVALGLSATTRPSAAETQIAMAALKDVGLEGLEHRKPRDLSGGQQSRAALARVGVMKRPIVLLDEPFAALGPAQRRDMLTLLSQITAQDESILIMVTHDPDEAAALGGLVSFVKEGQVQAPVEARRFFDAPSADFEAYAGARLQHP